MYNSTIITKKRRLDCGCFDYAFSKNRCKLHATIDSFNSRQEKEIQEEGLSDIIKEADAIISKFVRLSAADKEGLVRCYICDNQERWLDAQCMHYIKRGCLFLRHDLRNLRSGCKICNEYKGGNLIKYAEKLEQEKTGITEILFQESLIVYKPSRTELKSLITEYTIKVNNILK